jgi:hypothetical protein
MAVLPAWCLLSALYAWRNDVIYSSVTNTHVKENPCMVLIPSSVLKSTGKYGLMKPCMVTLPFPILNSKVKYCMAEKPSHV